MASMNDTERHLAVVKDYADLHAALRARAAELGVSREVISDVAGFQNGYAGKILAPLSIKILNGDTAAKLPRNIRRIGMVILGPLLRVLAVKLHMVEDVEALAALSGRRPQRRAECVRGSPVLSPDQTAMLRLIMSELGRRGARARNEALTPDKRQRAARRAARARWRRKAPVRCQ
jgi:hypothetical protein